MAEKPSVCLAYIKQIHITIHAHICIWYKIVLYIKSIIERVTLNRPGFLGDLTFWENIRMKNTYSPEIRQRAVRLYQEQRSEYPTQWAATVSIASKFGCTPETLRTWIKKFEADLADNGAAADQAQRIKQLERDNKELQRANEILRKAAAFFAQAELDRK